MNEDGANVGWFCGYVCFFYYLPLAHIYQSDDV